MTSNKTTKKCFISLLLLVVGVAAGSVGAISLSTDPAAMPAYTGVTSFSETFSGIDIVANVDFAVYSPGVYPGSIPAGLENKYLYAYQVFNTAASNTSVELLTVGLSEGVVELVNPTIDQCWSDASYGVAGGIASTGITQFTGTSLTQKASFGFFFDVIGADQYSEVVLFSSDNAPTDGYGTVTGGAIGYLPTPIPEPCTLILLGGLVPFALKKYKAALR